MRWETGTSTRRWRFARLAVAAAVAAGCGGGSDTGTGPSPDPVATVAVDPPQATVQVGATVQLAAATLNAAGDTLTGRSVAWSTASPQISISSTGLVTALGEGLATVTATAEGKSGTATIVVESPPVDVSGTWYLVEQITDAAAAITCHDTATVMVHQTAAKFTGTSDQSGTCDAPGGPIDNSGPFTLASGRVSGTTFSFVEPGNPDCGYQGTITGDPATAVSGTVHCAGGGFDLTGTWSFSRTKPSPSVAGSHRLAALGSP